MPLSGKSGVAFNRHMCYTVMHKSITLKTGGVKMD